MEEYGVVTFISNKGLGVEFEIMLYIVDGDLVVISEMNRNLIPVEWIEEGKSVGYKKSKGAGNNEE